MGRISGIRIEVHWTFTLLLLWVVYLDIRRGGNLESAAMSVVLILFLFLCVVLHELGHALTARRFKIDTKKITLLPIGGVASLEKMPEKPRQELLVALAGPAVNAVIALFLLLLVPLREYMSMEESELEALVSSLSVSTLLFYLLIANIMLVAFNLIPAFPMDGGRVFRALLSFKMDRAKATQIAASVGQGLAVFFFIMGLFFNPFLILIALFIFIGAYGENKMVQQTSMVEGFQVKDATLTNITILHPEMSINQVVDLLIAGNEKDFVVLENDTIAGVLCHSDVLKQARNGHLTVGDVMRSTFHTLKGSDPLKEFYNLLGKDKNMFFPVLDEDHKLIGAIDTTNVSEFLVLRAKPAMLAR